MKCSYPQRKKVTKGSTRYDIEHACGQCTNCRITRKMQVSARIYLESLMHKNAGAFVTLTYAKENRPPGGSLSKEEAKLFKRRLRKLARAKGYEIKCVTVGEYGTGADRHPHYHLAIFGIPLGVQYNETNEAYQASYQNICRQRHHRQMDFPGYEKLVLAAWDYKGYVNIGMIEVHSAEYIAGYVTKKHLGGEPPPRGCIEEFITWDRRNAIGKDMAKYIADSMLARKCYPYKHKEIAQADDWIPVNWENVVQVAGKRLYLDRYMKEQVIKFMGGEEIDDDIKRIRNYVRSVVLRNRPIMEARKRNRPILEIVLSEDEKKQQRINRYKAIQRRKRKRL